MAIENLPRPWVLAALTGLSIAELLSEDKEVRQDAPRDVPRPEPRRPLAEVAGRESCGAGEAVLLN